MAVGKGMAGKLAEPKAAPRPIVLAVNGAHTSVLIELPAEGCMRTPSLYFRPRVVDLHAGHVEDAEMPRRLIPLAERFNRRVKALAAADVALALKKEPEGSPARQRTYRRYLALCDVKRRLIGRAKVLYQESSAVGGPHGLPQSKAVTLLAAALRPLPAEILSRVAWGVAFAEMGPRAEALAPTLPGGDAPEHWDRAEILRRLLALPPKGQAKPRRILRDCVAFIRGARRGRHPVLFSSVARDGIRVRLATA
jgi:hypothetical protein